MLPSGEVKELGGPELDLISDAEGITGLISEVTLRVQPLEEMAVAAIGCPDAHDLQQIVQSIIDQKLLIFVKSVGPK